MEVRERFGEAVFEDGVVRCGVVDVALEELLVLLLLLAQLDTVATTTTTTTTSRLLASPPCDGGQTWPDTLTSPTFRQALSDNTGGESKIIQ